MFRGSAGTTILWEYVFYPNAGGCPERTLHPTVEIGDDWLKRTASEPDLVIAPGESHEGATRPLEPSVRGPGARAVRELRDPATFEEDGEVYLLYSVAGEQGIAIVWLARALRRDSIEDLQFRRRR